MSDLTRASMNLLRGIPVPYKPGFLPARVAPSVAELKAIEREAAAAERERIARIITSQTMYPGRDLGTVLAYDASTVHMALVDPPKEAERE